MQEARRKLFVVNAPENEGAYRWSIGGLIEVTLRTEDDFDLEHIAATLLDRASIMFGEGAELKIVESPAKVEESRAIITGHGGEFSYGPTSLRRGRW